MRLKPSPPPGLCATKVDGFRCDALTQGAGDGQPCHTHHAEGTWALCPGFDAEVPMVEKG